jgi:hypothetical protein
MRRSRFQRHLATALAATLLCWLATPVGHAGSLGSFSGRVVGVDGIQPRAGVTVWLMDSTADRGIASAATDASGSFRIADAPAGNYRLAVEAQEGAYLLGDALTVQAGDNPALALRLSGGQPNFQSGESFRPGSGLSPTIKWVIVGAIVIAGAFVIREVSEDSEDVASPF